MLPSRQVPKLDRRMKGRNMSAEKGVQKKDGDYGIAVKGFLLERIIKAKQDGRNKSK